MKESYRALKRKYNTKWTLLPAVQEQALPGVYHPMVEKILAHRGINRAEDMQEFLSDKPLLTHDPYLMKGMREGVERIGQAIKNQEKIVFYGDYDVDGITSAALLIDFFFPITKNIEFYIPLRQEEGYGLNREALQEIRENYGADLVITADCGISAVDEVAYANSIGLDIIVTDHHSPGESLPNTIVINPKQPGCQYPFKDLAGCGICFKLAQALQTSLNLPKSQVTKLLDLVAMATVCDVVPLINENRTLLKYGLEKMRTTQRVGLNALFRLLSMNKNNISVRDLGFVIGPHFNASGRMDDARLGVQLLVTQSTETANTISRHLQQLNIKRRDIQDQGLVKCQQAVETTYSGDPFLLIEVDELHEGVIGIIAGRIRDEYYKPTIVLTSSKEPGIYTGSGRSVDGFHLFQELQLAENLMKRFGGHANACGLKIKKENIDKLRKHLRERVSVSEEMNPELLKREIKVVEKVDVAALNESMVELVAKLEPFGMGNEKPYFLAENVTINDSDNLRFMGKDLQHVKVNRFLQDQKSAVEGVEIIGFSVDDHTKEIMQSAQAFDMVCYPQMNEFRGARSIQLLMKDLKMTKEE